MSPLDREPDLWPFIRDELSRAILDAAQAANKFCQDAAGNPIVYAELEEKFRRGEREHKRAWLGMTDAEFAAAIREELLDLINYAAMRRVIRRADQEATR